MSDQEVRIRTLERRNRRLQERLNRITKLVPGRQRIWQLDAIANMLHYDADTTDSPELVTQLRAQATVVRRLEWDLGKLRDVVRGDQRSPSAKYDPTMWKGDRP